MSMFRPVRNLRHFRQLLDRVLEDDFIPDFTTEDADEAYQAARLKGLPDPATYSAMHIQMEDAEDLHLAEVCSQLMLVDAYDRGCIQPETFVLLAELLGEQTDEFLDDEEAGQASFPAFISVPTFGNA